ncbi:MAG: hypothetical protein WD060_09070, partial [Pirellulales bacterium]
VAGLVRRKRFIERPLGVRIYIVADQGDLLDVRGAGVQQVGDLLSRSVQWPKPAGGFPNRMAITFASAAPSSNFGVGDTAAFLRTSGPSKPSRTKARRTFSTVCLRHPTASLILTWPRRAVGVSLEQDHRSSQVL